MMGLISIVVTVITLYYSVLCLAKLRKKEHDCETLQSKLSIIKEEYDELGLLERTCYSEIAVNKCEGTCISQVTPNVSSPTGFLKDCSCCKESFLRERVVTLAHCFDPDGMQLTDDENHSMDIRLREPADCQCYKCGDFSR